MPTITREDWIAEVERLGKIRKDGVTTKEIADALGIHQRTAMQRIKKLGWVYVGKKLTENYNGVYWPSASYLPPNRKKS